MVLVSPRRYPFWSVGVVEIWYGAGEPSLTVGSGFLFRTASSRGRRLVLGAGHDLVHLGPSVLEVHFSFYAHREVHTVATRPDGSPRHAIAGITRPFDFGVMVLADDAPKDVEPIPLRPLEEGRGVAGLAAGGLASGVAAGDRAIYTATAEMQTDIPELLYFPSGTIEPGMSGGPVLTGDSLGAGSMGILHGTGMVDGAEYDVAVATNTVVIEGIDALVDQALADP